MAAALDDESAGGGAGLARADGVGSGQLGGRDGDGSAGMLLFEKKAKRIRVKDVFMGRKWFEELLQNNV